MTRPRFPDIDTVLAACIPENLINKASGIREVYRIPEYPQFVFRSKHGNLRDLSENDIKIVPDRFEGRTDFGQPCVEYGAVGALHYLQPGLSNTPRNAEEYAQLRQIVAAMEPDAYEKLVEDLLFLKRKNIDIDPKPSNLMIDPIGRRFGLVDVATDSLNPVSDNPESIACVLMDNAYASFYEATNHEEMQKLQREILEKVIAAAEKVGLPVGPDLRNDSCFSYNLELAGLNKKGNEQAKEEIYRRLEGIVEKPKKDPVSSCHNKESRRR